MRYLIALLLFLTSNQLQAQSSDVFDSLLVDLEIRTVFKDSIKNRDLSLGVRASSRASRRSMVFEIAPLRPADAKAVSVVKFELLQSHLFVEFDSTLSEKKQHFKKAFVPSASIDLNSMSKLEYREYSLSIAHMVIGAVLKELFKIEISPSNQYFKVACKQSTN